MKHILKGAAAVVITMIANIAVNVICNMNNVELNTSVVTAVSLFCALAIYHGLIHNENKED